MPYLTALQALKRRKRERGGCTKFSRRGVRGPARYPGVTGQTFPNPEKGCETSSTTLVGFANCFLRCNLNAAAIYSTLSGLGPNADLLPRVAGRGGRPPAGGAGGG